MIKFLLTCEYRFFETNKSYSTSKTITIGIFDKEEDAITKGNETIEKLKQFVDLGENKFSTTHAASYQLVTNCCKSKQKFHVFLKITPLNYLDVVEMAENIFQNAEDYYS